MVSTGLSAWLGVSLLASAAAFPPPVILATILKYMCMCLLKSIQNVFVQACIFFFFASFHCRLFAFLSLTEMTF